MDICGEGLAPSKKDLLKLADQGGVKKAVAEEVIQRIAQVAGDFKKEAKNFSIRKTTVATISGHIEENRARMA
jgi:serine/threonine-protein kinase HipA